MYIHTHGFLANLFGLFCRNCNRCVPETVWKVIFFWKNLNSSKFWTLRGNMSTGLSKKKSTCPEICFEENHVFLENPWIFNCIWIFAEQFSSSLSKLRSTYAENCFEWNDYFRNFLDFIYISENAEKFFRSVRSPSYLPGETIRENCF